MPIRPNPHTYTCTACGWSKTVAPRSDALMPGEYFKHCPVCNSDNLQTKPANAVQVALSRMAATLQQALPPSAR